MSGQQGAETITVRVSADDTQDGNLEESRTAANLEARQQARRSRRSAFTDMAVPAKKIGNEFNDIIAALEKSLSSSRSEQKGLKVDMVKVGLAFSGIGKLVLVGEMGVQASIEVTLRWA